MSVDPGLCSQTWPIGSPYTGLMSTFVPALSAESSSHATDTSSLVFGPHWPRSPSSPRSLVLAAGAVSLSILDVVANCSSGVVMKMYNRAESCEPRCADTPCLLPSAKYVPGPTRSARCGYFFVTSLIVTVMICLPEYSGFTSVNNLRIRDQAPSAPI